ncbi:restriction endonuclease subunit S [Aeromonas hydrophila]|uniref:restriction endonuclease subunit S n=1 Tax=Aeromonas hydrophila TaxID=644 RepID=UPI002B4A750D|nr:restriction endonuclease subunit S [Aeromonas hydrophila]
MRFAHYKELDSSSVSWLQQKPIHWRIKRLKFSTDLINNKVSAENSSLPYLGLEHIESWTGRKIDGEISNSEGLASSFVAGDVLFGKLRPYLAKVHLAQQDGLISSEALVIRSKEELHSEFLKYYMLSRDFINIVNSSTYGSKMPRASWDFIGNLPILLPEIEEQKTIARFLDFKTAQVDALIAKKKALLDKLAEKRTALISHAVTKGLDPSVPMKDSGVTWLGDIPAHWMALPLRRLIQTVKTGTTPAGVNEFHFSDSGVSWFRPGDFSDHIFIESAEKKLSDEGFAEVCVFPAFTVMHVGIGATIGKVGVTTEPSSCNQQINAIVCNERLHHLFAAYFLRAIKEYIVKCGKYTTLPIINQDETKALCFTVPPLDEQVKISEYLLSEEQLMQQQANKISQVIAKLQEYRSALITNAVTGKIDVRGFIIPAPAVGTTE